MLEILQTVISTPLSAIILATFAAAVFADRFYDKL